MEHAVGVMLILSVALGAFYGAWKENAWAGIFMFFAFWMAIFAAVFVDSVIAGRLK